MECEWDPVKAASNLKKYGVSFEEAATALADDLSALDRVVPARRPRARLIFHTDRGIEYAAYGFRTLGTAWLRVEHESAAAHE